MNSPAAVVISLGALVSAASALLGVFLVLRRTSMLTDAISHSILLGIVVFFFIAGDVHSPLILVGAALAGVLTVFLTEVLRKSGLVKEDAAIGLVFPALFALAVLLLNVYAENVHLDVHAVLLGEIIFAPFDLASVAGVQLPRSVVVMAVLTLVNLAFVTLLFKELKLATFDPALATALGFSPALLHYGLLSLTSVTAVGAFDAVGAILVIAFMIIPPTAAYLLTDDLRVMIALSVLIGVLSSTVGYFLAVALDVSVSGMMATVTGLFLVASFLGSPRYGVIAQARRRQRQALEYAKRLLLVHLLNHEHDVEPNEREPDALQTHLRWTRAKSQQVVDRGLNDGLIERSPNGLELLLTDEGRRLARSLLRGRLIG